MQATSLSATTPQREDIVTDEAVAQSDKFHGTHTMGKEFWTAEHRNMDVEEARARRRAKRVRHERNAILHAAWNQYENGGGSKPLDARPIGGKKYFDKHGERRVSKRSV